MNTDKMWPECCRVDGAHDNAELRRWRQCINASYLPCFIIYIPLRQYATTIQFQNAHYWLRAVSLLKANTQSYWPSPIGVIKQNSFDIDAHDVIAVNRRRELKRDMPMTIINNNEIACEPKFYLMTSRRDINIATWHNGDMPTLGNEGDINSIMARYSYHRFQHRDIACNIGDKWNKWCAKMTLWRNK